MGIDLNPEIKKYLSSRTKRAAQTMLSRYGRDYFKKIRTKRVNYRRKKLSTRSGS